MKVAKKPIAVIIAVLAVGFFLIFVISDTSQPPRPEETPAATISTPVSEPVPENKTDWPLYRGNPGLTGMAPGSLPDSLERLWKFETAGQVKSSPVISQGMVYVGSADANLYAIDLKTRQKKWVYKTEGPIDAPPCTVAGSLYVGSTDDNLYCLDARTGSFKWKYKTEGQIIGSPNFAQSADNRLRILTGSYDNNLHCLDARTGKLLWKCQTQHYINGSPAVDQGKTVFGGCDELIHVVSLDDGTDIKQIPAGSYIAASAALTGGHVYVGTYAGVFLKADISTGEILWRYQGSQDPFFSSPALTDDLVVFGGQDNRLHAVDRRTGQKRWLFNTQGQIDSSPVICGDKIVVGSFDGRVYMLRLADGTEQWSYEIGQPIESSPAVSAPIVVIGSGDGGVYAFGPGNSEKEATP